MRKAKFLSISVLGKKKKKELLGNLKYFQICDGVLSAGVASLKITHEN